MMITTVMVSRVVMVVFKERVMVCQMLLFMTSPKSALGLALAFSRARSNTTMVALME